MSVKGFAMEGTPAERAQRKRDMADLRYRVRAIYESPGGAAGCCCHILLDDRNYDDSSIEVCIGDAIDARHAHCLFVAEFFRRTPRAKRAVLRQRVI